jgi:hypothetical protein
MIVAEEWSVGEVFLTMLYFYLFFLWVWLVITVFADIFRSRDQSGWAKAGWAVLVIALPFLGVFIYVVARGSKMGDHAMELSAPGSGGYDYPPPPPASAARGPAAISIQQLSTLAEMHEQGLLDDSEFERMKAKVTAGV